MENNCKLETSETQAIIDLASQINPVEIASQEHIKRIALPPGWSVHEKDDEKLRAIPYRKKGKVVLSDQDSFIEYINRHKIPDSTTIFCEADYRSSKISFDCIINDHSPHTPDQDSQMWRDFTATYTPLFSEEWNRWTGGHKRQFSQIEFATFIEENLADVASAEGFPSGKDLFEMAVSFETNQDLRLKSHIRLQSGGVNFHYVENDDDQTLKKMTMFERIAIGIPVFWNGNGYQITARLRYRVREGKATFWYELVRQDKVIEDATKTLIEKIKTETGVPLFFGKP